MNTCILVYVILHGLLFALADGCDCLKKPFKVESFTWVTAHQGCTYTSKEHEVGVVPVKIEVQVFVSANITGSNQSIDMTTHFILPRLDIVTKCTESSKVRENTTSQYVFPGIGSSQRDDDVNSTYGGIVYTYNQDTAHLYFPCRNDGTTAGTVIYTGGDVWVGPSPVKADTAQVRIRVWRPQDFPCPDFNTSWLPIKARQGSASFIEIKHGIGAEPEYVSVQIKNNKGWITDGIGSVMMLSNSSQNTSWGGVLFAYNDSHVRIWAPGNSGSVFSTKDGWGSLGMEEWNEGSIMVKVWRSLNAQTYHTNNRLFGEHAPVDIHSLNFTEKIDINTDIVMLLTKATDGANKDFLFSAMGAVQNAMLTEKYGGVVYSYSNSSVNVWHPPLPGKGLQAGVTKGFIIYIDSLWGGGKYTQSSTSAQLILKTWKPYDYTCPVTTPTTSTSTSLPTTANLLLTSTTVSGTTTKLATTYTVPTSRTSMNTSASVIPTKTTQTPNLTGTQLALIVTGSCIGFILLLLLFLFCIRRLLKRKKQVASKKLNSD